MNEPFDVVATIQVEPGRADEVVAIVSEHLADVRAEEGCLRYDLYRVRKDPETLVMIERWATADALRAHGAADHFLEMSSRLAGLLAAAPVVRVLEAVDAAGQP